MSTPNHAGSAAAGLLEQWYHAGVSAADPAHATAVALEDWRPARPVTVIAFGKAAPAMAGAAVRTLGGAGIEVRDGIVASPGGSGAGTLLAVRGDHPLPAENSARASEALSGTVERISGSHAVLVLLSGGTSSLIGAPVPGLDPDRYHLLCKELLAAGLDIHEVNTIRKTFSRWGGGRLAAELPAVPVLVLAISDVPGNDLRSIGSGPLTADQGAAERARGLLQAAIADTGLRRHLTDLLDSGITLPEVFSADIETMILADNRTALEGAANAARAQGYDVAVDESVLAGEAKQLGARVAREWRILGPGNVRLRGGEPFVTAGPSAGKGGRCQELALAAAFELAGNPGLVILAAGTDGRDGPTDAAGAIVDSHTWEAARLGGRDPATDLENHDSYHSLDAAAALLRTGPTGTNVMDMVIGISY